MRIKLLKTMVIDGSVEFAPSELDVNPDDLAQILINNGLAEAVPVSMETATVSEKVAEPESIEELVKNAKARKTPKMGKEIQAKLTISPDSLKKFNAALGQLREAVREKIVKEALLEGGGVIKAAAESRAPGPHIEVEFMKGSQLNKGSATGLMKKDIQSDGLYVAIGPDKAHWYYRFRETGTVAHTVKKRKRTVRQQMLKRSGVKAKDVRKQTGGTKPVMAWMQSGKLIFARKVSGMVARPFLRPAIDENENETMQAIAKVLAREIKKAAKG